MLYRRNLAVNETRTRQFVHSILFYISALIVTVLAAGIFVILGLSAFDRL